MSNVCWQWQCNVCFRICLTQHTLFLSCIIHKDHERRFMWFYVTNYSPLHDWALGGREEGEVGFLVTAERRDTTARSADVSQVSDRRSVRVLPPRSPSGDEEKKNLLYKQLFIVVSLKHILPIATNDDERHNKQFLYVFMSISSPRIASLRLNRTFFLICCSSVSLIRIYQT